MLKKLILLVWRLINLGVPEGAPPEEAKHVWATNLWIILEMLAVIPFILQYFEMGPLGYKMALLQAALLFPILLFVLVLNGLGRTTTARVYLAFSNFLFIVFMCALEGREVMNQYYFLFGSAFCLLIFPRSERRLMLALAAIFILSFFSPNLIYNHLGPWVHYNQDQILVARKTTVYSMTFYFLIIIGVSRWFTDRAEERVAEANRKISVLSEKLKSYLPHQFVKTLAENPEAQDEAYRRRKLTVCFSDIQGFTDWTDKHEPEDTRELLNRYFSEMSKIAHEWGGTIDKFIGDAIMIFFGDPEFTDDRDHALRCVKMALAMQERMISLRREWENEGALDPLHIRIGVHTGYATVGNFGAEDRLSYTALGSAVNLASRLESAGRPDRVTVSHSTYSLIKDQIACEPIGQITVKGFSEPVKVYEAKI